MHCDNLAIVFCTNEGKSKCPLIMALIRTLFFTCAFYNFDFRLVHIPGVSNLLADALSRDHVSEFLQLHPTAEHDATTPKVVDWRRHA